MAFNYKNAFFQVSHKADGTYLKLFPPMGDGKPLTIECVTGYFNEKRIMDYDLKLVNQEIGILTELKEIKISETVIPAANEYLSVMIAPDRMKAVGRFYPPSTSGKLMEKQEILERLKKCGVHFGILEEKIDAYLKNRVYCTNIRLAEAKPPIQGKNAEIKYFFEVGTAPKPRISEDGSVDFHQLDNISKVNKGDVLAELIPADTGMSGKDVGGAEIKPYKVSNLVLRHGNNIHLSEDGLTMFSDTSGHVSLADDRVFVSNTYEVPADVGAATGDIEYDGNVLVRGNVITGFRVKATGDIIVEGVVEGASLAAGGQIVLKRGIQGMGRGTLTAEGDIITKFIENSLVSSMANITTDAIMHSNVSAKGDIIVTGRRGLVTGGEIKSGNTIEVKTAGSTMGTVTVLEVGIDPTLLEKVKKLEKDIAGMTQEKEQAEQIVNIYKRKLAKGEKLPADKVKHLTIANTLFQTLDKKIKEAMEENMALKEEMDHQQGGRIRVENKVFPGVKIIIANNVSYIRTETHHCQFVRDRADIKSMGY